MNALYTRLLAPPRQSFFLFGPRGVGKSTWIARALPDALRLDLLDASLFLELSRAPHELEAIIGRHPPRAWVVLDEIQKCPALLDEVQRLMMARSWRFALSGSSARKLRRGGANLLAGRALTRRMFPFVSAELGDSFCLDRALAWGNLPYVINNPRDARDILNAYVHTYLREEIREEGVVRTTEPFVRFLAVAGMMNGCMVNGANIARDAAVSRTTVDTYFSVLDDTLLGTFLPAYRPKIKVREATHPKFYWFDSGVARAAAGLLNQPPERDWLGRALETQVLHELRVHNEATGLLHPIAYYRTPAGAEVDFVVETRRKTASSPAHVVALEVKLAEKWNRSWEAPIRDLARHAGIRVTRMCGIYTGSRAYHYDGFDVLPAQDFFKLLHSGKLW